jgi:ABC-type Fe3+-hydroxamate transport system substrate-binding protein
MTYTDQVGNNVTTYNGTPERIVSLVPSQTELLADLGLEQQVVGITKFCIYPPSWRKTKTIVGGTKNFHFDTIHSLKPDLIIGNKEENYQEGIVTLQETYPVWLSDIVTLEDARQMILAIGTLTARQQVATTIVDRINKAFATLRPLPPKRVVYLIWRDPWMAAGPGTFIDTMLTGLGLINAVQQSRYPTLTPVALAALAADYILLSSEPYPFQEKHMEELRQLCPTSQCILVDGEMFSWYGSRLIQAPAYFNSLTLT